ncbi:MAG TPA: T9SS type A sorting domain-containing protein [Ignavibacteriaceae bacterium]|nr:T9SS type A sorting domain-containing protein [Ignavibacteriaceae bacterium]
MKKSILFYLGFLLLFPIFTTYAQVVDYFYPLNDQYGTGYLNENGKIDGNINLTYPNVGWAVFDISSLPEGAVIQSVEFFGYIIDTSFPTWSSTPMGTINPVTASGTDIYNQIITGYGQNSAYIYVDEWSSFNFGWYNYDMGNEVVPDLQAAVNSSQGWFAIGFIVRDFNPGSYLIFEGHSGSNWPYIGVTYEPVPVELSSFRADAEGNNIILNWQTATETNNKGFEIQRNSGSGFDVLGFVKGSGTSTEKHVYSYTDKTINPGRYTYRLRQVDFDGNEEYSKEVEVNVDLPDVYDLGQNYPNPFNPTTQIYFSLAADSKVTLKVFNILGQEVTTLLNQDMTAGVHKIIFDASRLTSGVYLYKLEANGADRTFTSIKKMILTK